MIPAERLIEIAAAVGDGAHVEWEAVVSAAPPADRAIVHQLRLVDRIASLHASVPPAATFARSLRGISRPFAASDLPSSWGPLRIVRPIGSGTFADVYLARDPRLDRPVALKLLRRSDGVDSEVIEEARLLARVRHPNVVTVFGAERIEGRTGIWMEYIDGQTLEQELRERGPLSPAEILDLGMTLCGALHAVHAAGLIHRDVKAQNVLRDRSGRLVLTDFGTGRDVSESAGGEIAGTPMYLAPEVLSGGAASEASDVYSLGVLLFRLATGMFPIAGRSLEDVKDAHRAGRHLRLATARPELPPELIAAVDRAIAPLPDRRFRTVDALAEALRARVRAGTAHHRVHPFWLLAAVVVASVGAVAAGVFNREMTASLGHRFAASGRMPPAPASIELRKVATPVMGLFRAGTPSFDGRFYSNTDLNEDMQLIDLATGVGRRLTDKGRADEYAEFSAISPDGSEILYSWWLAARDAYELRLIHVGDANARVLVPASAGSEIVPIEWARDGSAVLCLVVHEPANRFQVALVSVPAGTVRIVAELGANRPQHVALSPDARFVAYDAPAETSTKQHDIFIQGVDGSARHVLLSHPADDVSPEWTPDGGHLFFLSNRSGTYDGWSVEVVDGVASGDPVMVVRDLGEIAISGFTSAGALYFWRRSGDMDVFTRDIDLGAAGRPERLASGVAGVNSAAAWSADGRFLAYLSRRGIGGSAPQALVVVHPLNGGPDREIPVGLRSAGPAGIRLSPDGREMLLPGEDAGGREGTFVLQMDSGHIAPAVLKGDGSRSVHWWIDGRSFAYIANSGKQIVVRERGSQAERVIFDGAEQAPMLRLEDFEISPDGRSLAIGAWTGDVDPASTVLLVGAIGGVPSEVMRTTAPDALALQAWAADGHSLLVTRRDLRSHGPHALWRVDLGGAASDTGIRIPGFTHVNRLQLDPAGRRIAYTADQVSWDLWVMERFLP